MYDDLPLEETDKYKWINQYAAKTGIEPGTLAELYLKGWIVKPEEYVEQTKDGPIWGMQFNIWKKIPYGEAPSS